MWEKPPRYSQFPYIANKFRCPKSYGIKSFRCIDFQPCRMSTIGVPSDSSCHLLSKRRLVTKFIQADIDSVVELIHSRLGQSYTPSWNELRIIKFHKGLHVKNITIAVKPWKLIKKFWNFILTFSCMELRTLYFFYLFRTYGYRGAFLLDRWPGPSP